MGGGGEIAPLQLSGLLLHGTGWKSETFPRLNESAFQRRTTVCSHMAPPERVWLVIQTTSWRLQVFVSVAGLCHTPFSSVRWYDPGILL